MVARIILWISLLTLPVTGLAQKQDRVWIFGDHGGINFNDTSNVFSFYSGLMGTYVKDPVGSISDLNGNLLFYAAPSDLITRSTKVFSKNDSLMSNGDDIEGHPSQSQGLLILPFPGDTNKYYIFTKDQLASKIYMYYSIVDMTQNNGFGAVISKNNKFWTDSLTQRTTAVKHANGRDWWLIVQRWDQDEYLKYLIKPDNIYGPYKQSTGNPNPKNEFFGTSYFSRSGSKLVSVGFYGNIGIMDFDRCTGDISNYQQIGDNVANHANAYIGCAFSANENVLYVANSYPDGKYVYQYDLTAFDIKASKQTINMYPDTGLLQYVQYGHLLLGADNRIYVSKGNGSGINSNTVYTQNIDVILNPDVVGPGCDYRSNYMYLNGGRTTYGLPNMVNYTLGPVVGSICDSLSIGIGEPSRKENHFTISPNPIDERINLYGGDMLSPFNKLHISLYDVQGKLLFEKTLTPGEHSVLVPELNAGVFVLKIQTKESNYLQRIVKLNKK